MPITFLTSKLKRAIDSFYLLGCNKPETTGLLNEADFPHGLFKELKMPFIFWGLLFRILWISGLQTNCESYKNFKYRLQVAYSHIGSLLENSNHIVIMGHGMVNMELKRLLKINGWHHVKNYGGHDYWSSDVFIKSEIAH